MYGDVGDIMSLCNCMVVFEDTNQCWIVTNHDSETSAKLSSSDIPSTLTNYYKLNIFHLGLNA